VLDVPNAATASSCVSNPPLLLLADRERDAGFEGSAPTSGLRFEDGVISALTLD
jgi:hypothetical protein